MNTNNLLRWASFILLSFLTTKTFAGFEEGNIAFKQDKFAAAMVELQPLADGGNADAQYMVGLMMRNGGGAKSNILLDGVPVNEAQSVVYFAKAAEQNNVCGAYYAGHAYLFGKGVPKDADAVQKYLRIAADSGEKSECAGLAAWEYANILWLNKHGWVAFGNVKKQWEGSGALKYVKIAEGSKVIWAKENLRWKKLPRDILAEVAAIDAEVSGAEMAEATAKQRAKEDEEDDKDVVADGQVMGGVGKVAGWIFSHNSGANGKDWDAAAENKKTNLRFDAALRAFEKRDFEAAYRKYKHQADRQYIKANLFVGLMLHDGLGVQKDDAAAFQALDYALGENNGIVLAEENRTDAAAIRIKKYYTLGHYYLGMYYAGGEESIVKQHLADNIFKNQNEKMAALKRKDNSAGTFIITGTGSVIENIKTPDIGEYRAIRAVSPYSNPANESDNLALIQFTHASNDGYAPAMIGAAKIHLKKYNPNDSHTNYRMSEARSLLTRAKAAGSEEAEALLAQLEQATAVVVQPPKKDLKEIWGKRKGDKS